MATILLADDGSETARDALIRGLAILGRDHHFIALTVVPPAHLPGAPLMPMDSAHYTLPNVEADQEMEREEVDESTVDLTQLIDALGIQAEEVVEVGEPAEVIIEVAERYKVDAIVIGSRGHGFVKRVLLGSVSNQVLQHAPCPVLVVR